MSQFIYNSDNYPLFDIFNNQYQTLIQESYNSSGIERKFNPKLITTTPTNNNIFYHSSSATTVKTTTTCPISTHMKKSHPSKYQNHAFSIQLCQKLKANKRKQQYKRLQKLQQIQIMKKNINNKSSSSLPSPTSPSNNNEKRTCHAFSSQLYSKLKGSTLTL